MKILVLSLTKKLRKADKTEYFNKFDVLKADDKSVDIKEISDNSFSLGRALDAAVKEKYDFIVVSSPLGGKNAEDSFRSKFAYIIPRGERKIQKAPSSKKKGRRKKGEEIETISYQRKITHVFPIDIDNRTAYAFNYVGAKVVFVSKNIGKKYLENLIERVSDTFKTNEEAYPDGYSTKERSVRVLTFFERHFPIKSDPKGEKIRKSVMLAAICAFVVAAYFFVQNIYLIPMHNNAILSEIQTIFYEGQGSSAAKDANKITKKNWKKLKKINKEIVGWVKIDSTTIDYPVLWHKGDTANDQYYLWRNYKQEYYHGGATSIFLDWRSKKGMDSRNVILHGHHMEDGTMFSDLLKYGAYTGNLKFYKKAPVIKISTPKGGTQTYKIISIFKSNVDDYMGEYFDFYCGSFKNDAQFLNYIYNIRIRSLINCPVNVNEDDQLLSLVTCSYEFGDGSNFRTMVVARKCRKGESEEVDTSAATVNKKAVWPQCYYSRFGGTRPTVSTFRNEYKKGKVGWYDGTYSGKGSEQLPTSYTKPTEPKTTAPTTTAPTTQQTTKPKKTTVTVKIYGNKKTPLVKKTVKAGANVKLPKIKSYKKGGYTYSLKKWKATVKGKTKPQYLKKNVTHVTVPVDVTIRAIYKKTKIKTTPKPTEPKPTTPTTKPTQATTALTEEPESEDAEE